MNFQTLVTFAAVSLCALVAQAQITIGSDFKASSTLSLGGLASPELLNNMTSVGHISGSSLDSSCAFFVRQTGVWKDPSTGQSGVTPLGSFGKGGVSIFKDFGIPNGAIIDEPLDVFTGPNIDLDIWFTVSFVSPCIAHYTCTGGPFAYTYTYNGLICGPPVGGSSRSAFPSATSFAPVPSSSK
ncbi:hypothetical protein ONZ45_g15958 [Pleurotus djamor]|nr:hypothetical protein ONZ45_g15958 [Pleurotus djamor]